MVVGSAGRQHLCFQHESVSFHNNFSAFRLWSQSGELQSWCCWGEMFATVGLSSASILRLDGIY